MSALLDEIIQAATDGKQPLADILRKCLRLGHELKSDRLKKWANDELSGYDAHMGDLPRYRIVPGPARGNFLGPFQQQRNHHIIASLTLEEQHREFATTLYLAQSVSAYENVAANSKGVVVFPWPGDLVAYYSSKLMPGGFNCRKAWQEIPIGAVVEVLDTIRNTTLKMALEIKDELGTSYDNLAQIKPSQVQKVGDIIVNTFIQNTAHATVDASHNVIVAGDQKALDSALRKLGLDGEDLKELTSAIEKDQTFGERVTEWVKDKGPKLVVEGLKKGAEVGQVLLTQYLKQYFGLP